MEKENKHKTNLRPFRVSTPTFSGSNSLSPTCAVFKMDSKCWQSKSLIPQPQNGSQLSYFHKDPNHYPKKSQHRIQGNPSPAALLTDFLKAISLGESMDFEDLCLRTSKPHAFKQASFLSIWRQIQVLLGRARAVRTRGQPFCT